MLRRGEGPHLRMTGYNEVLGSLGNAYQMRSFGAQTWRPSGLTTRFSFGEWRKLGLVRNAAKIPSKVERRLAQLEALDLSRRRLG